MAQDSEDPPAAPRQPPSDGPSPATTPMIYPQENRSTETVRRVPAHRSAGYGTITSPEQTLRQEDEPASRSQRQAQLSATATPHTERQKKPPATRRASSKRVTPHRGQEFSVDDDIDEVEQDYAEASSRLTRRKSSVFRRRGHVPPSSLTRVQSYRDDDDDFRLPESSSGAEDTTSPDEHVDGQLEDDNVSDAESFTLKDRQQAINQTHPFGIRIWKPALYKKSRSVQRTAEGDIHSSPGGRVNNVLFMVNLLWTIFFGWWLALAALLGAIACFLCVFSPDGANYGRVFLGLARYLFYPFGSFVRLDSDEHYAEEDEGEGRSISEYEQWQSGDLEYGRLFFGPQSSRSLVGRRRNSVDSEYSEHDSLLGRTGSRSFRGGQSSRTKRRLFGRGRWSLGRVVFFAFFYFLIGPLMLLVSLVCWLLVFWIPMARVMDILVDHLRRHPLALSFHSDDSFSRLPASPTSSILLCTYRAAGLRYWKYTVDGTNIFLINLLSVVVFVIFDHFVLGEVLGLKSGIAHPGVVFTLALISIIPLAYFIGQAVASISAQSSMGLGAAINAFFSTIVEVYLYCVALSEGKAQLVEGSIIGSIFAGILFLPGLSMCFGAIKRKTQRFNVKSAGVTSTMLLFAVIAAFGPTLFYQIYGRHELVCNMCVHGDPDSRDCRRCYFSQVPAIGDAFFIEAVQPFTWFCAVFLFLSYIIGLWFTLRTHAAVIWATDTEEKKPAHTSTEPPPGPRQARLEDSPILASGNDARRSSSIRDSQFYKRVLGQSLNHFGLSGGNAEHAEGNSSGVGVDGDGPAGSSGSRQGLHLQGLTDEDNQSLTRQVAEVAATAATVAARDAAGLRRSQHASAANNIRHELSKMATTGGGAEEHEEATPAADSGGHGHDAPNWSKTKSSIILLVATILYAVIAEILVNTVDVVLTNFDIDEKFLGITLFALVPNTTEFLNAISFAINGNIALSMEIGSAYALQVCLLQVPALVLFSAIHTRFVDPSELLSHSFNLIFPQWDMISVILCVFLLSYVYSEGKSNYFKGSVLVLTYLVMVIGFYLSGYNDLDVADATTIKLVTVGRRTSGVAYKI